MKNSITHNGITVNLSQPVEVLEWITGEPYIRLVGDETVTVTSYTPSPKSDCNLAMKNPKPGQKRQGLDSRGTLQYKFDSSMTANLPIELTAGDTLVIVNSLENTSKFCNTNTAMVLKVVNEDMGESFRPAITDRSMDGIYLPEKVVKTFKLNTVNIRDSSTVGFNTDLRVLVNDSWASQFILPRANFPEAPDKGRPATTNDSGYGVVIAHHIGEALQLLMKEGLPEEEFNRIRNDLVQAGIDHHHNAMNGGKWSSDGGHMQGMKTLIFAAGFYLCRPDMFELPDIFAEDGQVYYREPDLPEWGIRHRESPAQDLDWFTTDEPGVPNLSRNQERAISYRNCCTAHAWATWLPFIIGNGLQKAWNNPALFDYFNRYMFRQANGPWQGGDNLGDWRGKDGADVIFDVYNPVLADFIKPDYPTRIKTNIKPYGFGNSAFIAGNIVEGVLTLVGRNFLPSRTLFLSIGEIADEAKDVLGAKVYTTMADFEILETDESGNFIFNANISNIVGGDFCLQAGQLDDNDKLVTSNAVVINP